MEINPTTIANIADDVVVAGIRSISSGGQNGRQKKFDPPIRNPEMRKMLIEKVASILHK